MVTKIATDTHVGVRAAKLVQWTMIAAFVIAASMLLVPTCYALTAKPSIFDSIITARLIASACKIRRGFSFFRIDTGGPIRAYQQEYRPRAHPLARGDYYMVLVGVGRAETFLTTSRYQHMYDEFSRTHADRETFRAAFPPIGARALREFFGFGPGGSAYGLTFTTKDKLYDVRIVMQMLLSNSVPDPACDVDVLARRIETKYRNHR
jgi:hypothetical protein